MVDLQREIALGEISKRSLDELKSRFDQIRENIHLKWEQTKAKDIDEREILYHKLHALNELERSFVNDIDTAKLATAQLEAENARRN